MERNTLTNNFFRIILTIFYLINSGNVAYNIKQYKISYFHGFDKVSLL